MMLREEYLLNKFLLYCQETDHNTIIVVEGKKDEQTLRFLNVPFQIVTLAGLSIIQVTDLIYSYDRIIILTDFDKKGKQLRNKLKNEIQMRKGHGIIDSNARQLLYKFFNANRIFELEDLQDLLFKTGWKNQINL